MRPSEKNGRPDLPVCTGKRFAIVAAQFYDDIAEHLIDGAKRALLACNVAESDIDVVPVPGCFEIPLACRNLIEAERYDALVALGAVVRGETPHFDYVAGQCASGIMAVQLATGVPIGFGILTTDTRAQAQERADPAHGDKGYGAAIAAASLIRLEGTTQRAGFRR